jgi:hypothetical protein
MDNFPHGRDYAWLAVDAVGHVAVFTNAGAGPIPTSVLANREQADRAELEIRGIRVQGHFVTLPYLDSFLEFAHRGLFAYDWQDAHRKAGFVRQYELQATPVEPATVDSLPPAINSLASIVRFDSIRFLDCPRIDVAKLVVCYPE